MSETQTLAADDLAPLPAKPEPQQEPPPADPQAQVAQPPAAEDDDPADGLTETEEKLNALRSALTATRGKLRDMKPAAEENARLKQQLEQIAPLIPYAQFVQANPHLLQPQQQAPQEPAKADPLIEATAKRYDLYTPDGKLDLERASAIVSDQRQIAREEAQAVVQPYQQQTHQTQLQANIQWMSSLKTADGQTLEREMIEDTIRSIYGALPQAEALKVLADPKVAQVVGYVALGRQAATKKGAPQPGPLPGPALHVETAGGSSEVRISDGSRTLFNKAGISEKDALASAKRFKPGVSNVLE